MKRFFALILCILLLISCLPPVSALADEYTDGDKIGTITWNYDDGMIQTFDLNINSSHDDGYWYFNNDATREEISSITVNLDRDVTTNFFPQHKYASLNINLNGHTWTVTDYSGYYGKGNIAISGGTLTFKTPGKSDSPIHTSAGNITLRNVVFKDCNTGTYPVIHMSMQKQYTQSYGGGVIIKKIPTESGTLRMDNVHFINCTSTTYGGCVYIFNEGHRNEINNCTFTNCHSAYGGAIYFGWDTNVNNHITEFVNCEFNNCYATKEGGGIYSECGFNDADTESNIQMINCTANQCHAKYGGFISVYGNNTRINGAGNAESSTLGQRSNIIGCYSDYDGGAYYCTSSSGRGKNAVLKNFNIISCTAGASAHNFDTVKANNRNAWGGAACFRNYNAKLQYCDLYDNFAPYYGGAVYMGWSGSEIDHCTFRQNRCSENYGQHIYIDASNSIEIKNTTVYTDDTSDAVSGKTLKTNGVTYIKNNLYSSSDIENGDYVICTALNEKFCVDISYGKGSVNKSGASAILWENGEANVFTITKDTAKDSYIIKSKVTGLPLDVSAASKDNGADIQQWEDNGTDAQRWVFEDAGNGYCYIRCLGGQYMDASGMVNGAKPSNGVNIQSWEFTGADNQKFKFKKVSGETEKIGTQDNPYIIRDAAQWMQFAHNVTAGKSYEGKYIELAGDITAAYVPVGNYNIGNRKPFKGNFDGKNHTVRILDASGTYDRGLFSYCEGATVKNINVTGSIRGSVTLAGISAAAKNSTFENCTSNVDIQSIGESCIAGIVANATDCTFINCTNNGTLNCGKDYAAGIAAETYGNMVFIGCRNNGNITAKGLNLGGIAGFANDDITIKRCTNNAKISSTGSRNVGGILGYCKNSADIISCINTEKGIVEAEFRAGGIVGWVLASTKPVTIKNCANCADSITARQQYAAGIVVNIENDNMTVENCFNFTKKLSYYPGSKGDHPFITAYTGPIAAYDVDSKGNFVCKGKYINCYYRDISDLTLDTRNFFTSIYGIPLDYKGTELSAEDCKATLVNKMNTYIRDNTTSNDRADWLYWSVDSIRGCALPDLVNASQNAINGSGTESDPYIISTTEHLEELANDLNHGIDYQDRYFKLTNSITYTGAPLGINHTHFAGHFDGDYHTVAVQIDGGSFTGLFSELNGATVKNLTVSGYINGADCVGGIAGHAYANTVIDNCHVTATVTGTSVNVGGIVGMAHTSTISNCRVDGTVTGHVTTTGGVVGWLHTSSKVINCVGAGKVIGDVNVGNIVGLAQWGDVKIINCSALGSTDVPRDENENPLSSGKAFGGIIGCISDQIDSISILNCFSKCSVGGSEICGFIVGSNEGGKPIQYYTENDATGKGITTLFYTNMQNGLTKAVGSDPINGDTASATSKSELLYAKTSDILTQYASGKKEGDVALTSWTNDTEKKVLYPKSFVCDSSEIRGSGTVIDPYRISLPEHLYALSDNICAGESYAGKYFRVTRNFTYDGPKVGMPGRPFSGIFDGDYHTLKLAVKDTTESETGLFCELNGAKVTNLEISGKVDGVNGVGGIAGYAYGNSVIDNCHISATIKGTAENCGGVIGMMDQSTVSNCRLDGSVTGALTSTGGIVGGILSGSKIYNCVTGAKAKITGETAVGGIVGCVLWGDPVIINCANLGSFAVPKKPVWNTNAHGGIVGIVGSDVNSASILGCFTTCKFASATDRGYIAGAIGAPENKVTAESLYYVANTSGLSACGRGTAIKATVTPSTASKLEATATKLTDFARKKSTADTVLTPWRIEDNNVYPRNYIGILSFTASVFSLQSLPAFIVIGTGLLAGIVTTAVLFVRKKKNAN